MIIWKVSNKDLVEVKPLNLHNMKIRSIRLKKVRIIYRSTCKKKRRNIPKIVMVDLQT